MKLSNLLGFAFIFPWWRGKYGFVPGQWTPRFDQHGRIYMLISPCEAAITVIPRDGDKGSL